MAVATVRWRFFCGAYAPVDICVRGRSSRRTRARKKKLSPRAVWSKRKVVTATPPPAAATLRSIVFCRGQKKKPDYRNSISPVGIQRRQQYADYTRTRWRDRDHLMVGRDEHKEWYWGFDPHPNHPNPPKYQGK